jgi:Putative zinc-finger
MNLDSLSCRRGRELVSLELDGEISQLEEALLGTHLAICEDCRSFRAQMGPATATLRAAPLEQLERAIVLPPHRAIGLRTLQVGAAAAVVAIAGAASLLLGPLRGEAPARASHVRGVHAASDSMRALQLVRRPGLIPTIQLGKAGGRLSI